MATNVRDYRPTDAEAIVALFNRHRDVSNPVEGGITAAQLTQELADRETHTFLVAEDDDTVVGTFGLFHSDGRRVAEPGELIADMFFVAPAHRAGMLTPQLFATAIERVVHRTSYEALRLTVNPANAPAYTLYRRVGCLAVGPVVPGADGNVALHNFLPLVIRQVRDSLPAHLLTELMTQRIASVPRPVPVEMGQDVQVEDGRRVVRVPFAIGDVVVSTVIDLDHRLVLHAQCPGWEYRPDPAVVPPAVVADKEESSETVLREGDLTLKVDHDGTVEVWRDGHLGPVWTSFWPSTGHGRNTGWRAGNTREVRVDRRPDGSVDLVEELTDASLAINVALDPEGVTQRIRIDGGLEPAPRSYHQSGLRNGRLRIDDRDSAIGDGLGVRDAGQVPAAQEVLEEGTRVEWTSPGSSQVSVRSPGSFGLINGTVAELRNLSDGNEFQVRINEAPVRLESNPPSTESDGEALSSVAAKEATAGTLRLAADAGGVVSWKPFGRNVFRVAYPRTRAFANNPRWSAGLWAGGDVDRFDRANGPGWGVVPVSGWEGTAAEMHREGLSVSVTEAGSDSAANLTVTVEGQHTAPETALWMTPDTANAGSVACFSPYDAVVDGHDLGRDWSRWTRAVSVPLRGARFLTIWADPESPPQPELLVRSTRSGLLVTATARTGMGPVDWYLDVTPQPITSWNRLPHHGIRTVAA